jgi:hypothetical protein
LKQVPKVDLLREITPQNLPNNSTLAATKG